MPPFKYIIPYDKWTMFIKTNGDSSYKVIDFDSDISQFKIRYTTTGSSIIATNLQN